MLFSTEEGADAQSVLQEATDLLHTKFGFYSITIQVELYSEDMSHCSHCQDPSDWYPHWTAPDWTQQDMERDSGTLSFPLGELDQWELSSRRSPLLKDGKSFWLRSPSSHKKVDNKIIHVLVVRVLMLELHANTERAN